MLEQVGPEKLWQQLKAEAPHYAKLLPAIVLYLSYFLLLSAGKAALERGSLPPFPGLYSVPLLFVLLFALPLNLVDTRWFNRLRLGIKGGKA